MMIDCRHFNGYKPCGQNEVCDSLCPSYQAVQTSILIVHLEALGAVARATSLLLAIKRKFPDSQITWVTQSPAHHLLRHNPYIDRVLTTSSDDLLALSALEFDVGFCLDKSLKAAGVVQKTRVAQLFGFRASSKTGGIIPATEAARELWELGLNDKKKFYQNQKSEVQLMREACELSTDMSGREHEYVLPLTESELAEARLRHEKWTERGSFVIGLNTGSSHVIPYKKMSVEAHRQLIKHLSENFDASLVLLGGPEDETRNQRIAHGLDVIRSNTGAGLRDGLVSVEACDMVLTGDSLGMHMAIGRKKWVVAWFGPTCAQEIELYGRGQKILAEVPCGPCWKRSCQKTSMCYDQVAIRDWHSGVLNGLEWLREQNLGDTNRISRRSSLEHTSAQAPPSAEPSI